MATFSFVFVAITLLAATSNAAPKSKELTLNMPEECKGQGFCNVKPEGYDEIEDIINSLLPPHLITQNFGDRNGDASQKPELSPESDWHNCPYRKSMMAPFTHNNSDIIIQTNLFQQPIEEIFCAVENIQTESDVQCFQDFKLSSFNMRSKCETSTTTRTLFVFDPKTQEIKSKPFEVSCCCSCKISKSI